METFESRARRAREYSEKMKIALDNEVRRFDKKAKRDEAIIWIVITLVCAMFILMAVYSFSEASPFLVCDPQSATEAGDRYEYRIDAGEWKVGNRIDNGDGTVTFRQDMAPEALADGEHTFEVRACNLWRCGDASDPLANTKTTPSKALSPSLVAD